MLLVFVWWPRRTLSHFTFSFLISHFHFSFHIFISHFAFPVLISMVAEDCHGYFGPADKRLNLVRVRRF